MFNCCENHYYLSCSPVNEPTFGSVKQLLVEGSEKPGFQGVPTMSSSLMVLITLTCYITRTHWVLLKRLSIARWKRNMFSYSGWNWVEQRLKQGPLHIHLPPTQNVTVLPPVHHSASPIYLGSCLPCSKGNTHTIKLFKWKLLSWAMTTFLFILIV